MKSEDDHPPSLLSRLSSVWSGAKNNTEPENSDDLVRLVKDARERSVVDSDTSDTLTRVLQMTNLQVRDVMIPRSQMTIMSKDTDVQQYIAEAVRSRHSRYPVIDGDRDHVVGILLAKDLLRFTDIELQDDFSLRDIMRPAVFIPESKRLNVLLNEFRASRNHMAIVVDEYGGTAGLITIEDVLEQIVGNIEDEHDLDNEAVMIVDRGNNDVVVKALCPLDEFNAYFGSSFDEDEYDTIGGYIMAYIGRVPDRDEVIHCEHLKFEVLHADSRRLHLLRVERLQFTESMANTGS